MNATGYHWDFLVLWEYRRLFFPALWTTVYLSLATIIFGIVFGLAITWLRSCRVGFVAKTVALAVELIRSLPPLVILVWFYYCTPIIFGIEISAVTTVIYSLGIYAAAFYSEIFRSGLQTVDRGCIEAALSVGMSRWNIFRRIIFPIAFRNIFPPFVSQGVLVIKNTSLAGYIAVSDILYMGQRVSNATFRPIEVLSVVALTFIVLVVPLTLFANRFESRMARKYSR